MPTLNGGGVAGIPTPPIGYTDIEYILYLAGLQLQDQTQKKWDPSILVPYMNLVIREIITVKPESYPVVRNITLSAGVIQSIGTTDILIIDAVCNMGSNGITVGQAVTGLNKGQIDTLLPGWMSMVADTIVSYVIVDQRDPKTFYVWPPQPASPAQNLRVIVSQFPDIITDSKGVFPLDQSYWPTTVDLIVSRALKEETTIPNALAKAVQFEQSAMQKLGVKTAVETRIEQKGN